MGKAGNTAEASDAAGSRTCERRVAVILNRRSGRLADRDVDEVQRAVRAAFQAEGHSVSVAACEPDDLDETMRSLPDEIDTLVAGGGDGTLLAAAKVAIDRGWALAPIPLGTLNLFARDLGVPLAPVKAAQVLARGTQRPYDLADVNGQPFLTNTIMGTFPSLALRRERARGRGWTRVPIALWEAIQILAKRPPATFELTADGERHDLKTRALIVSNDAYDERLNLLATHRDERGADGKLYIYVGLRSGITGFFRVFASILLGRWRKDPFVREIVAERVDIETEKRRVPASLDGEVRYLTPPLHFTIRRGALTVLTPRGDD